MNQILQKDLRLFRFKNVEPHKFSPWKYQYQLFNGKNYIKSDYSDNEFRIGLVTIEPGKLARLELVNEVRDVELNDENIFLVSTIEIPNLKPI